MTKKFSAFISFTGQDELLGHALYDLIRNGVGYEPFFAPVSLPANTHGRTWRQQIAEALRESSTFVPVITHRSMDRSWVNFESGAAEVLELPRFSVRTNHIRIAEINSIAADVQVISLADPTQIVSLLGHILAQHTRQSESDAFATIRERLRIPIFEGYLKAVINLASVRWVFIAGNQPAGTRSTHRSEDKNGSGDHDMALFVRTLARELLNADFSLVSCPQVPCVGKVVWDEYLRFRQDKPSNSPLYRIGGLYPIDSQFRKIAVQQDDASKYGLDELGNLWNRHLHEFRKSYLNDVEWLILVGGNQGTLEEYLAGKEAGARILSVPHFGGTGKRVWEEKRSVDLTPYTSPEGMPACPPASEVALWMVAHGERHPKIG